MFRGRYFGIQDRSQVDVVQVTNLFGIGWGQLTGWGNQNVAPKVPHSLAI